MRAGESNCIHCTMAAMLTPRVLQMKDRHDLDKQPYHTAASASGRIKQLALQSQMHRFSTPLLRKLAHVSVPFQSLHMSPEFSSGPAAGCTTAPWTSSWSGRLAWDALRCSRRPPALYACFMAPQAVWIDSCCRTRPVAKLNMQASNMALTKRWASLQSKSVPPNTRTKHSFVKRS